MDKTKISLIILIIGFIYHLYNLNGNYKNSIILGIFINFTNWLSNSISWDKVSIVLERSQFLQGTVSVFLLGSISASIYMTVNRIKNRIYNSLFSSLSLSNEEEAYGWVMEWLQKQPAIFQHKELRLKINRTIHGEDEDSWWAKYKSIGDQAKPEVQMEPGFGIHSIWYKGSIVWFNNYAGEVMTRGWDKRVYTPAFLDVSVIGRKVNLLQDLLDDVVQHQIDKLKGKLTIYQISEWGGYWQTALNKVPRSLDSVILDKNIKEEILADAKKFLKSSKWYKGTGIPYRRGVLLYGPPGTGKTSFVQALAGQLKLDICVLTLSNQTLNDRMLNQLMRSSPPQSVVLLEDVDSVFVQRDDVDQRANGGNRRRITFSGLLNAIDGIASQEGRILFMTTNHIEKLDSALIRPGRCDLKLKFGYATRIQISNMFKRFFGNFEGEKMQFDQKEIDRLSDMFAEKCFTLKFKLSMASLQEHFMKFHEDPKKCFENIMELSSHGRSFTTKDDRGISLKELLTRIGHEEYLQQFYDNRIYSARQLSLMGQTGMSFIVNTVHKKRIEDANAEKEYIMDDFELMKIENVQYLFETFYLLKENSVDDVNERVNGIISTVDEKVQLNDLGTTNDEKIDNFGKYVGDRRVSRAMLLKYFGNFKKMQDASNPKNIDKHLLFLDQHGLNYREQSRHTEQKQLDKENGPNRFKEQLEDLNMGHLSKILKVNNIETLEKLQTFDQLALGKMNISKGNLQIISKKLNIPGCNPNETEKLSTLITSHKCKYSFSDLKKLNVEIIARRLVVPSLLLSKSIKNLEEAETAYSLMFMIPSMTIIEQNKVLDLFVNVKEELFMFEETTEDLASFIFKTILKKDSDTSNEKVVEFSKEFGKLVGVYNSWLGDFDKISNGQVYEYVSNLNDDITDSLKVENILPLLPHVKKMVDKTKELAKKDRDKNKAVIETEESKKLLVDLFSNGILQDVVQPLEKEDFKTFGDFKLLKDYPKPSFEKLGIKLGDVYRIQQILTSTEPLKEIGKLKNDYSKDITDFANIGDIIKYIETQL